MYSEVREVNHHGKTIKVGPDGKPIHGDEQAEDDKSINSSEVLFSRYKLGVSEIICRLKVTLNTFYLF